MLQCRRCRSAVRFCPCCGAALQPLAEKLATTEHRRLHHPPPPSQRHAQCGAICADEGSRGSGGGDGGAEQRWGEEEGWMQWLPSRPVTAFEVFAAEKHSSSRCRAEATSPVATETVGVADSFASPDLAGEEEKAPRGGDGPPCVVAARSLADQRAAAVEWLGLTSEQKQHYEALAQQHMTTLTGRVAAAVRATATETDGTPPTVASSPTCGAAVAVHLAGGSAVATTTAGADTLTADGATAASPPKAAVSSSARRGVRKAPKHASSSSSTTSFNLFRAELKGRKLSMAEAALAWQTMPAEEKARYDAAAASYRTENYLAQTVLPAQENAP